MGKWKQFAAQLVKRPLFQKGMIAGIHLIVPKKRISASLVVFDDQDRVLLLKHVFHPYIPWGLPGGWLSRNESPEACARRELREETGLTAVIGPPIKTKYEQDGPSHIEISYLGWVESGIMQLSNEILEARWVELDKLPKLFPFAQEAIEKGYKLNQLLGRND